MVVKIFKRGKGNLFIENTEDPQNCLEDLYYRMSRESNHIVRRVIT